jgi:branched-chain amino acid transport system ATP-binding protein
MSGPARPAAAPPLLTVEGLDVAYGDFQVLWGAELRVDAGEIVCVLGPNGAGKSTLMNTISGLLSPRAGRIAFLDQRLDGLLGAHNPRARPHRSETLARVEGLFPVVRSRRGQLAHTLSGGEQQMVAIARGLMARPRLLMIDEPFLGLAPHVVAEIGHLVRRIRDEEGIGVVFIEQNVELALRLADRGYVLESGRTILSGPSADLLQSPEVKRIFLGDAAL